MTEVELSLIRQQRRMLQTKTHHPHIILTAAPGNKIRTKLRFIIVVGIGGYIKIKYK